ncbi:17460_t:CDS:1, partial [Cetraspora pellucida]
SKSYYSAIEILNVTSYLAQSENNSRANTKAHIFSLIELNSQMKPSLEALPLLIEKIEAIPVASTL